MGIIISPPVATININGHTYTNADWEANTPGVIGSLGNDIATVIADAALVGVLTKTISGNVVLSGPESSNIGFIFVGALTGIANITFGAGFHGIAQIENQTTGGFAIVCGLAAGTTVSVPSVGSTAAFCDGTNFSLQSGIVRTSTGSQVIGTLDVSGGTLSVSGGNLTVTGTALIGEAATFNGTIDVASDATVGGNLSIPAGNVTVSGTASIGETGTFGGSISVASDASVGNNLTVAGTISVVGTATFDGAAQVDGNLNVVGGQLSVDSPTSECEIIHNSSNGQGAFSIFQTSSLHRWYAGKNSDVESGSDVGSDYIISSYHDSGAISLIPFKILRANGRIILADLPTSASGLASGTIWNNGGVLNVV